MNFAHVHVVLNHIPSLGTVVGAALFLASVIQKKERLQKLSLQILVVMALVVLPTYVSGNASQRFVRRTEIPQGLVEVHQNSAMITLALMTITGTFAWFGLWQFRRFSRPGFGNSAGVLILSILASAAILRTANLGGDISHPEIRTSAESIPDNVGWRMPVERFSNQQSWVWPACETIHFIGMPLLFGVVLILTLRMLGMMKGIPYSTLHRLLPLAVLGFVMNVISGMIFFMASPGMYYTNTGFVLKVMFILLAGVGVLYFTMFDEPWAVGPDKDAPFMVKVIAVCTIGCLLGVMLFGRMLPFMRH